MFDRFLKNNNQPKQNSTSEKKTKSSLDELNESANVLDKDKMNQVGGGHTTTPQFSDQYDWNSSLGGTMPS